MSSSQLRILVPLENPAAEHALIDLAVALADPPWGELHLTHVVTPHTTPVSEVEQHLAQAASRALQKGVGAIPHLERGEDVTGQIQQAVRRWSCNMMLMGWKAEVERQAILAAHNRALAKAVAVDTLIFKERDFKPARRILVPTGGGHHSLLGVQVAHDLARTWQADLQILRVARDARCRPEDPLFRRYCDQLTQDTQIQLQLLGIDVPFTLVPSPQVVPPIVERARDSDLVVVGASNDWRQEEHLAGSIPDEIANQVPCSVLMVRSAAANGHYLNNIFWENTVRLDLRPADKWEAIAQMVDALIEEKQIPLSQRQLVLDAALNRERKSSTALGHDTAIPHAPIPDLPGIIGCLGICPQGLDFQSPTGQPVHFIFLLLTPQQNYRSYIPILSQIAHLMRDEKTRKAMLACQTPSEVTALIKKRQKARK
jgi:mannitol/fructose-specific phosphotransferase system IIA component (Ntr-type)/nucleotide-binding universal stress UspA family protein